jgi:hypothetical protein
MINHLNNYAIMIADIFGDASILVTDYFGTL